MSEYLIDDNKLIAIADEIRKIVDSTESMSLSEIISYISELPEQIIGDFIASDFTQTTLILKGTDVRPYAFSYISVENIWFKEAETLCEGAFSGNENLKKIRISNVKELMSDVFRSCTNLKKVIIETPVEESEENVASPPCKASYANIFSDTPIESREENAGIYVPQNLVNIYQSDSGWSQYQIFAIEDYPNLFDEFGESNK